MVHEADDLHHKAFLALRGVFPVAEGEKAIADLLRSSAIIDPLMREQLAQALCPIGKSSGGTRLKLSHGGEGKFARRMRTQYRLLKMGKEAVAEVECEGDRRTAFEKIGEKYHCGLKRVEQAVTYAKAFERWCEEHPGDEASEVFRLCRESDFHTATLKAEDVGLP